MAYVDTHLEAGERVLFRTRLHPVVFAGTAVFSACVVGAAALIVARNELAGRTIGLLWLSAAAVVAGSWVSPLLRWRTSEFAATSRRLRVTIGMLHIRAIDVTDPEPKAIEVEQSRWGRWLDYGTLEVIDDGGVLHVFPRVSRADALRDAVRRQATAASRARAR